MVKESQVVAAMKSWGIRFKDRSSAPVEMTILAKEYYDDLVEERISSGLFDEIVKLVRRRNTFFPKMVDILDCREEAEQEIRRKKTWQPVERKQIEPPPASNEFGLLCIKNINLMLSGKITQDEAVRRNTPTYGQGGNINLVSYPDHKGVDGSVIGGLASGMSFNR